MSLTNALRVAISSTDTTLNMVSVNEFPTSGGTVTIDSEQITYITGSDYSLISLTRGVNSTSPASHAANALITLNTSTPPSGLDMEGERIVNMADPVDSMDAANKEYVLANVGSGTVTSVSGTAGNISSTGGTTPVLNLVNTAVTPGSYTSTNLTVDVKGRITAATNGSGATPGGNANDVQLNNGSGGFSGSDALVFDGATMQLQAAGGNPSQLDVFCSAAGSAGIQLKSATGIPNINFYVTGSGESANIEIEHGTFIIETANFPTSINDLNDDGAAASSALLDLRSGTRGLLPPRNTNPTGNIGSPAEGLIAQNTTSHDLQVYNGTTWVSLNPHPVTPSVQVTTQSTTSTSGTTYVATGLSHAFALSNASHKVKVTFSLETEVTAGADEAVVSIFADGVDIVTSSPIAGRGLAFVDGFGATIDSMVSSSYIYSPGDTSSHTYDIRIKTLGGGVTVIAPAGDTNSNMVIEEIV